MTDEKRKRRELIKQMQKEIKEHPTAIVDEYRAYSNKKLAEIEIILQRKVEVRKEPFRHKKGSLGQMSYREFIGCSRKRQAYLNEKLAEINKKLQKTKRKKSPSAKIVPTYSSAEIDYNATGPLKIIYTPMGNKR